MGRNVIGGNTYNCQTLTHDELTYIHSFIIFHTQKKTNNDVEYCMCDEIRKHLQCLIKIIRIYDKNTSRFIVCTKVMSSENNLCS